MNCTRTFRQLLISALLFVGLLTSGVAQAAQPAPQRDVLREITDVVGLKPRFELRATTQVENAAAVVSGGKRYLLYNPNFVAAVNRASRTDWAGVSILAHEMGHHLNGHTLQGGGSNPADELEADEFSGFVLRKMGASLAQAQAAMAAVADDQGSSTHPGRSPRLAAIGQGWQRANSQIVASTAGTAPSAAPAVVASRTPAPRPMPAASRYPVAPVADDERGDTREAVAINASGEPVRLVGQLTFRDNPSQRYYLTSGLKVLRVDDDQTAEVVGRMVRTTSPAFPYVLTDDQQRRLFVTGRGDVYDKAGKRVAKLHDSL